MASLGSAAAFLDAPEGGPVPTAPVAKPSAASFLDAPDAPRDVSLDERFSANFAEGHSNTLAGAMGLYLQAGAAARDRATEALVAIDNARSAGSDRGIAPPIYDAQNLGFGPATVEDPVGTALAKNEGKPIGEMLTERTEQLARADALKRQAAGEEMQRQRDFAEMPAATGVLGKTIATLGYLAGGGATPESLVPVGRAETFLGTLARGAAVNAATTAAADPIVQQAQVDVGTRKTYDPTQTLLSAAIGGVAGGVLNVAPEIISGLAKRVGAFLKKAPEAVTVEDVRATAPLMEDLDPKLRGALEANGILDAADPRYQEALDKLGPRLEARQAAAAALATPEGAARQADVNIEADAAAEAARKAAATPTAVDPAVAEAEAVQRAAAQRPPDVIPARQPPPEGRPQYSTVGEPPDAGTVPGLDAQRAQDAGVQRAFDQADLLRRRGQPASDGRPAGDYAAARAQREAAYAADQHIASISKRIGEDAPALVEWQFGVDHEAFSRMTDDARERLVAAAQKQVTAEAPAPTTLRTSDQALNIDEHGASYDPASRPQEAGRTTSQQPAENPGAPRQPTATELDTSGGKVGERPYARTATGTSDRPFVAEDSGSPTPEQARGFEEQARVRHFEERAKTEADLMRQWAERARADEAMRSKAGSAEQQQRKAESDAYSGQKAKDSFSNQAQPGADKRFATDQFGYVRSNKGGPIRFADQKQVAKWILNVGHKVSPDQVFEIANHPSGKGFTARERGRTEPPPETGEAPRQGAAEGPPGASATAGAADGEKPAAGALPAPEKGAAEAATAVQKSPKFYSNPLDPQAIKDLWGPVFRDVLGWAGKALDRQWDDLSRVMGALQGNMGHPVRSLADGFRTLFYANHSVLVSIASRYKVDGKPNPAILKLADMFFARPGRTDSLGTGRTFGEAVEMTTNVMQNRLAKALLPFRSMTAAEQDAALNQIGAKLRSGNIRDGATPIDTAAHAIRALLADHLKYLRAAGMDIGEAKNYFPRVVDMAKVLSDPKEFIARAKRLYIAEGADAAEAQKLAEAWHGRLLDNDLGFKADRNDFVTIGTGTGTRFEKSRTFSANADKILSGPDGFYLNNPAEALPSYIGSTVRRAEWVRRMGADLSKWQEIKAEIAASGAHEALDMIVPTIQSATGTFGTVRNKGGRMLVNFMRTWSNLRFLPKAAISAVAEPTAVALRSGNAIDAFRNYSMALRHVVSHLTGLPEGAKLEAARAFAEDIGAINGMVSDMLMAQRFGGDVPGELSHRLSNIYFKRTGLNLVTEAGRIATTSIARLFITRLAKDVAGATPRARSARFLLGELGVTPEQAEGFARWVVDKGGDFPDAAALADPKGFGEAYRTAALRFVNQTILSPKAAEKTRYAGHPWGSLFYALTSFNYSFAKNVVGRLAAITHTAVNPKSDLGPLDRLRLMQPLAMVPLLIGANDLVGQFRQWAFPNPARDPNKPPPSNVERLVADFSRTGMFGGLDPLVNIFSSARYQKEPAAAALGPLPGDLSQAFAKTISLWMKSNSENTQTAELNAARAYYNLFVMPALTAGVTFISPGLISAPAIQWFAAPTVREAVAKPVANALSSVFDSAAGGGSGRSSGRASGRSSGRSSGR